MPGYTPRELDYAAKTLYDPTYEHDNCGIGAVVNMKGIKSHQTVDEALRIVEVLEHRAGKDADGKTGDGVGILLQISHRFFNEFLIERGYMLGERDYGIGMFFFPQEELKRNQAKKVFENIVKKEGLEFLCWRKVPVAPENIGPLALSCMPYIMQAFIKRPVSYDRGLDFDRRLYVLRRVFEQSTKDTFVCSLSSRTIVYKGMFLVGQLRKFYLDLQSESYESAVGIVHSRFSTNTEPSWERAHPNRLLVHNGEINTIRGNADKMLAREETFEPKYLKDDMSKILPIVDRAGSDSARLDNSLEFFVMSGMDLPLAVMMMIPEPWANNRSMSQEKKDLYQYYATMMEPWDGPASIVFTDGDKVGAVLDRDGLRPSRYMITENDHLILASEVGGIQIDPARIKVKERLHPGKMLLVDFEKGELIDDTTLKEGYASAQPYGEWLDRHLIHLKDLKIPNLNVVEYSKEELQRLQKAFGYTYESIHSDILAMALSGEAKTGSMGVDSPIPVLADGYSPLFCYFKQLFAQVTNPPIDCIREEIVTATMVYAGRSGNILEEKGENARMLRINNPIMTSTDLLKIKHMKVPGFQVAVVDTTYYRNTGLENALEQLFVEVDRQYRGGANIIILSDRSMDENRVAIPSLLAVSGLHQYLVRTKKRTQMSIILETGEPRDIHHFATLLGYGAGAINPYLAQDSIKQMVADGLLDKEVHTAIESYNEAVLHGIVKIASKMGISTIQSYLGAKIFEAIGIDKSLIDKHFTGTTSRIGGITIEDVQDDIEKLHAKAFDPLGLAVDDTLDSVGRHSLRCGITCEKHLYNIKTIHYLQESTKRGDYDLFKQYTKEIDEALRPMNLRGLLDFAYSQRSVPIDEVESVDEIVKRFKTGAMSYGSISKEAHECLAIAMNQIGGKSNSGEGGEMPERLIIEEGQPNRCSAIKQVASGRFGVTSEYLVSAQELQIKMAQGAKPGEGGQLPGAKVYPWIAKTRHSTPGVGLISPPPHHDIYSIEDLEQLIFDLKNANREARISVKLVSEAGVGTIASGVAKAGAGLVLISGYDGGTGAAAVSSIHNTGLPWELGLVETHQTLVKNGLRSKVRLETDGKLLTGRDVAIAAIMGAEEFGFATAPLITMGCVMMRVCHTDTCPTGIATQNPELRKRFIGKPEYVVNFMRFIAQELREYMAALGVRSVDELVGRSDLLKKRDDLSKRAEKVDLSRILVPLQADKKQIYDPHDLYDFKLQESKDVKVLLGHFEKDLVKIDLEKGTPKKRTLEVSIENVDRSFGTIFGSEITKKFKNDLPEDTFTIQCKGAGGQSFGAFIPKGLTLDLEGDSNDYFGKGLSGGTLIIYPPKASTFAQDQNIVIGNVALYGATSGKAYVCGVAGERFCVRNSGATAVVEGVGDHGLEYMTGGVVAILGRTGKNFAAGMSGGIAYVLDEHSDLYKRLNKDMVSSDPVIHKADVTALREMIEAHVKATGSLKGKEILSNFEVYLPKFKKVIPHDYQKMLHFISQYEKKGFTEEQARMEAFNTLTKGKERA